MLASIRPAPSYITGGRRLRAKVYANACRRWVRVLYTNAYLLYLVHLAVAFHAGHGWSHAAAMDHVKAQSGFGLGIFVSYLFTVIWTADVSWWWVLPRSYTQRPRWLTGIVQGFLGFVVFNATVVYAAPPLRWAALAGFVALAVTLLRSRRDKAHR